MCRQRPAQTAGSPDDDYIAVGAQILPAIEDVYAIADMIVKVKEPIAPEYKLIKGTSGIYLFPLCSR